MEYYSPRIRYHASNLMSIEAGKTGMKFFGEVGCGGVASGRLDVREFARDVEELSYHTGFYAQLKATLTPRRLQRVVDELALIRRPMRGAVELLRVAQQCSGFRKVRIVLLNSLPARKVGTWRLPVTDVPAKLAGDFHKEVKKKKNVHAEMVLVAYLLGLASSRPPVFPYIGVSKKTCFLCGHILREMGFETRGNHGKCYSQWTLPPAVWVGPQVAAKELGQAVHRLRDTLRGEAAKDVSKRDAEKESVVAVPVPPRYQTTMSLFNAVVEDLRFSAREAEWFSMRHGTRQGARSDTPFTLLVTFREFQILTMTQNDLCRE